MSDALKRTSTAGSPDPPLGVALACAKWSAKVAVLCRATLLAVEPLFAAWEAIETAPDMTVHAAPSGPSARLKSSEMGGAAVI